MAASEGLTLLRVFLDTFQKSGHRPVYELLVERARAEGLRGATVLAGVEGLGRGRVLPAGEGWRPGHDREVVVEVLDASGRVGDFLERVGPLVGRAVVTLETVEALGAGRKEAGPMEERGDGVLLRVFLKEGDRRDGKPLCEALLAAAAERELAAATVLRGILGFGRGRRVHAAKWEASSTDLPLVFEVVDTEENVRAFLPVVEALAGDSLATLERVWLLKGYGLEGEAR